ncbi:uncharacterized protein FOMMEDRAFT_120032 [Fomitiporia mediterranea MF3/22]|uniref:uncharacterized protein n=1 Tax=Fomitiporia mediterranea (strain MF3/22) TaxID=694068 RepID=UPI00044077F3|nr:uncharacterized protein FOMMEDRAFT_120032 [Fomitiporia mediterranea MF3/22]EJD04811.1 hypothetical protein FOMMEDRAFT_120032 [Fomitiporia mediterranea MF3/22]
MCDECQRWSHMVCFDISVGKDPDEWRCWECHPRPVNVERARDRQARRVAAQARLGPLVGSSRAEMLAAAHAQAAAGVGTNQRRRRDRRTSLAVAPPAPPLSATQSGGGGDVAQEDEHVDIEDDWRTSYVHINEDIIPQAATRTKLGLAAQNWRGVTALSPDESSETDSRTKVVPLPNGKDDVAAAVRPPSYALQTTAPIANDALIAPFSSTIIPSAKYLADPLNAYAQMGLPKPHVHLVPPPLSVALDARMAGNETRFIRSGCRPNAVLRPVLCPSKQSGEDNDPGSIKFAVYAVRDLKASEEVVLGWEWDDGAVVHQLPALIEEGLRSGAGPSKMTPHHIERLRLQMQSIVESLKSSFVTCACGSAASDCAVKLMEAFAEGEFPWMNGFRGFRPPSTREKSKSPNQSQATANSKSAQMQNNVNNNAQAQAGTSASASQPHHQYHSPSPPQSLPHQPHQQQHQNAGQSKSPQPLPIPTPTLSNRHPTSFSALQDLSRYSNAKARARLLGPLVGKERGVRTRVVGGVESGGLEGVRQVHGDRWDRFGELDVRREEGNEQQAREGQVVPEVRVENATPAKRKVVDLKGKGKEKERVVRGPNGVGLGLGLELPTGSVRTSSPLRSSFRGEDREGDTAGQQVREVKEEQMPPKMRKRWIQQKMETLRSESAEAPPTGGSPRSDVAEPEEATNGLGLEATAVDKDAMEVDEEVLRRGQDLETPKMKDERSRLVSTPPPPSSTSRLRTNSMDVDLDAYHVPPPATSASAPAATQTSPRPSLHSILTAPPLLSASTTTATSGIHLRATSQPYDQPQQSQARKASSLFSLLNDHPVSPIHSTNRYLAQVMNPVSMDPVPSPSPTTVISMATKVEAGVEVNVNVMPREVTPEVKVDVEEEVVEDVQPAPELVEPLEPEPMVDTRQPTPAPPLEVEPPSKEEPELEPEVEVEVEVQPQPARSSTPAPAPSSEPVIESVPVVEESTAQEGGRHDEDEVKKSESRSLTPELSSALPSSPSTPAEPQRESEEQQEPEPEPESARSLSPVPSPPPSHVQPPAPAASQSPNLPTERPSIPEPEPAPPPSNITTTTTTTNIRRSVEVTSPTVPVRRLSEALTKPRSFTRRPRSQALLPRSESSGELSEVESEEEAEGEVSSRLPQTTTTTGAVNEDGVVNHSRSRSSSPAVSASLSPSGAKEEVKEKEASPEPEQAPASPEREEVVEVVNDESVDVDVDVDPIMLFKEELMQAEQEKKAQSEEVKIASDPGVMVNDSPHVLTKERSRSTSASASAAKEDQVQPDLEDVKEEMEVDVEVQVNTVVEDAVKPTADGDVDVEMYDDASSAPLSPAPSPSPAPAEEVVEEVMPAVEVQTPSSPASPTSPVVKSPSLATDEALPHSQPPSPKIWTELKPEPDSLEEKQAVLASLTSTLFPEAAPAPVPVPNPDLATTTASATAATSTSTDEARVSASPQLPLLRAPSPAVSVGSSSAQARPTPPPFASTSDNEHEHEHEHEHGSGSDTHVQGTGAGGERSTQVSSARPEPQKVIRRSMADYKQRKKKQREEEAAAKAKSLELASPVTPVSPLPMQELQKVAESEVKVGHAAPELSKVQNGMDAERSGNVDLRMEASHSPAASTTQLSPQVPVQLLGEDASRQDTVPKREAVEDRVDLLPSPVTSSKEERGKAGLSSPHSPSKERPTTPQPEDGEIANTPAPPPTPPSKPRGEAKSSTGADSSATAPTSTFSNPRTARLGSGGIAPPTQPRSFRDGRVLSASPPPRYNREPPPPPAPAGKSKIPPPWPSSRDRPIPTGAGTDSSSRTPTTPKEAVPLPLDRKAESMSPVRRASSYVPGPPPPPSKSGPSTTSGPPPSSSAASPTIAGGASGPGGMRGPPPSGPRALRATSTGMSTRTQAPPPPPPRLPLAERVERDRGDRDRERERDRDWEDRERARDRVHDRERESERDRRERERERDRVDRADKYSPPPPLPSRGRMGRGRYWARGRR